MDSIFNNQVLLQYLPPAIILVATIVYFYSRYKLNYWARRGVEQLPESHWLFGNFKEAILFRSAPGWHLRKLYNEYKGNAPFFGFYIFHEPCLQMRDPEIVKQMFTKDFDNFSDRYFSGSREKDSIGMRNLFGMRNPNWKFLRSKISPTFTIEKMKKMVPLMFESGKPMLDWIDRQKANEKGVKVIDGQDLNCKYATDIIANVGLGMQMDSFGNPENSFTKRTEQFFHSDKRFRAMISVFFLPKLVNLIGYLIYFDMSYFKDQFWQVVAAREKSGVKRGDYIDSVLTLKNMQQDDRYRFEGKNLIDQAGQFFSGFESGSITSSFTLMEIAKYPDVQSRAREEIQRIVAEHGWTYDALNEMKYLDNCAHEGIRMYPPVPFLDRRVKNDYKIPGTDVVIEKGTGIHVSLSALQRDPQYFEDPERFNPDRFLGGVSKAATAYMPFGIGPRMCIGSKLGLIHVKVVLAMILNEYEVYFKPDQEAKFDPRATFTVADNGLNIEFKKLPVA